MGKQDDNWSTWLEDKLKASAKKADDFAPAIKTIQAAHASITKLNATTPTNPTTAVTTAATTIATLASLAKTHLPTMQIMAGSLCDTVAFTSQFLSCASTIGVAANVLLAYQGNKALQLIAAHLKDIGDTLKGQLVLMAMDVFPRYIYDTIEEGLARTSDDPSTSHWFFVYHPDTVWSPPFASLVRERRLDGRFIGYTNQLDALFLFMRAAREEINCAERSARRRRRSFKPVRFHVLIPAYQPIVIAEGVRFAEGLGDFVVEGKTHEGRELVWLNVPDEQGGYLQGVGNWRPPAVGLWDQILGAFGWIQKPEENAVVRVLGGRQGDFGLDGKGVEGGGGQVQGESDGSSSASSSESVDSGAVMRVKSRHHEGSGSHHHRGYSERRERLPASVSAEGFVRRKRRRKSGSGSGSTVSTSERHGRSGKSRYSTY